MNKWAIIVILVLASGCGAPKATKKKPATLVLFSGGNIVAKFEVVSWTPLIHKDSISVVLADGTKIRVNGTYYLRSDP